MANINYYIMRKFEECLDRADRDMSLAAHIWFVDYLEENFPRTWECYLYDKAAHSRFFDEVFNKNFIDLDTFRNLPSKFQEEVMKGV